ncbi:hypothetical protein TNCV_534331 [Trichonephila clavipes]|nr:hypothetical protein TNCV_534331 [Trichonephila clavipes]
MHQAVLASFLMDVRCCFGAAGDGFDGGGDLISKIIWLTVIMMRVTPELLPDTLQTFTLRQFETYILDRYNAHQPTYQVTPGLEKVVHDDDHSGFAAP